VWSVLWLASAHALPPNSDGATVLLEVRALARGNLLLHGWRLSLNWFWAVDAPFSALAYLLVGLRPALPHVVPGLWALLVFWGLRRGRFGWGWVLAVVLFAAGMTGDLMIVAYGTGGVPQALESVHVAEAAVLVVCLALSVVRLITGVLTGLRRRTVSGEALRDAVGSSELGGPALQRGGRAALCAHQLGHAWKKESIQMT